MSDLTLKDDEIVFLNICIKKYMDMPHMRHGQAYFNALYEVNPTIANEIRGTFIDPFYNDSRIERFMNVIGAWKTIDNEE